MALCEMEFPLRVGGGKYTGWQQASESGLLRLRREFAAAPADQTDDRVTCLNVVVQTLQQKAGVTAKGKFGLHPHLEAARAEILGDGYPYPSGEDRGSDGSLPGACRLARPLLGEMVDGLG